MTGPGDVSEASIKAWMLNRLTGEFALDVGAIDADQPFERYGLSSRDLIMLSGDLEEAFGIPVSPVALYEHPTLERLAAHLASELALRGRNDADTEGTRREKNAETRKDDKLRHDAREDRSDATAEPIAIIGMACRFPGAADLDAFWDNLIAGRDAIDRVPPDRWNQADLEASMAEKSDLRTGWGGFVPDVDAFDASFFGISPREAVRVDPQQRLLLEVTFDALSDAGLVVNELAGSATGAFVGICGSDYGRAQLGDLATIDSYAGTGSALSIAANRLSYFFDWRGPSLAVDTACSSSLVAVHLACQSLRAGESTAAVAAGVNLILSPAVTINFSESGAMAADGRSKAFDARADGYVRADGVGVVVLKTLARAEADGDRVYAVIAGSAVNQDGRTNGLMAPNPASQEAVLVAAYRSARIKPSDVAYVEAHGTGTLLGDPIEAKALGSILGAGRGPDRPCRLGSVKTNIGHLEAAAGIAGLIKVALSLDRRQIPPSLHFTTPNPHIPFEALGLQVQTRCEPWPEREPLVAGVSSFGFGGTNAHAVLTASVRAPREAHDSPGDRSSRLLPLSARSPEALRALAEQWAIWLKGLPDRDRAAASFDDICRTAARRRSHFDHRLALVADTREAAARALEEVAGGDTPPSVLVGTSREFRPGIVFVCPGQGSQWAGMGRPLMATAPAFRESIVRTGEAFRAFVDWDLAAIVCADELPDRIDIVQPVLFAMSVAFAELWRSIGVDPAAVVGHSMGEVAAAHIAGVLTLEDAAAVVCRRSQLLRTISGGGAMAVVELSPDEVGARLRGAGDALSIAAVNSPRSVVVAGQSDAIEAFVARLELEQIFCRTVSVDVASHSPQVDPLLPSLREALKAIRPVKGHVPLYSTVTGALLSGEDASPSYWARNLREPVLFGPTVDRLRQQGHHAFVELAPHPVLSHAIGQCGATTEAGPLTIASHRRDTDGWSTILFGIGQLFVSGYPIDWSLVYAQPGTVVSLPAYPWQRQRFWRDPVSKLSADRAAEAGWLSASHPLLGTPLQLSPDSGLAVWRQHLTVDRLPYLADHRVRGHSVFPASGFVEMAAQAAAACTGDRAVLLRHVRFEEALPLPESGTTTVELVADIDPGDEATFRISSVLAETGGTERASRPPRRVLHASGRIVRRGLDGLPAASTVPSLGVLQQRVSEPVDIETFYARLAESHLEYGPAFRGVTTIWRGDGEALARLAVPRSQKAYRLHPALLDAGFQCLSAALPGDATEAHDLFLPVAIDEVRLAPASLDADSMWAFARVDRESGVSGGAVHGDIFLFTSGGTPVAAIRGLRLRRARTSMLSADWQRIAGWFHDTIWTEQAPIGAVSPSGQPTTWIVLAHADSAFENDLCVRLARLGLRVVLAAPGDRFVSAGHRRYRVNPRDPADFRRLLSEVRDTESAVPAAVIHAWSVPPGTESRLTPAALMDAWTLSTGAALHLIQALTSLGVRDVPRAYLITVGNSQVATTPESSLLSSTLEGYARTVHVEHPEVHCTTIDLPIHPDAAEIDALVAECLARTPETEIALREGRRYVPRLRANAPRMAPPPASPVKPSDGPYSLRLDDVGLFDSLRLVPAVRRRPGRYEVEIAVAATGLNFLDVLSAIGTRPDHEVGSPALGVECAGSVTTVGDGVTDIAVGDEVIAIAPDATSAYVIANRALVVAKPAGFDMTAAAAMPIAFATANHALRHVARLRPGERVLIHSAATGTGLAALHVARELGGRVFATAGHAEKRTYLRGLGVEHVFDSRSLEFVDGIRESTGGEGVDVVVNSLAGDAIPAGMSLLRSRGRFIEIGKRDVYANRRLGLYAMRRNISLSIIDLAQLIADDPEYVGSLLREALASWRLGHLPALPHEEFPIGDAGTAFRRMAQARHLGKIVLVHKAEAPAHDVPVHSPAPSERPVAVRMSAGHIRSDRAYLITGGAGAIGARVAAFLASNGARHIALVGRSRPASAAWSAITALFPSTVQIVFIPADVADIVELRKALSCLDQSMPPIAGVFHAAGVLDDGLLVNQTMERFEHVMKPKVLGAWNLHSLTLDRPLDHFVLFSSAAAVFGSPGQAGYAAANSFLARLARHRRGLGLPALAIHWGPWSDAGLAAGADHHGRLANRGVEAIAPDEGIRALAWAIRDGAVDPTIAPFNARQWRQFYPRAADTSLFADLGRDEKRGGARSGDTTSREALLALADPKQRYGVIDNRLRREIARVLHLDPGQMSDVTSLDSLGFDSLLALELRNRLEAVFDIQLSATLVWSHPSVSALVEYLAQALDVPLTQEVHAPPHSPGRAEEWRATDQLAASVAQLSDEDALRELME